METILTLVIAIGGIATGVGAIWAAMLARRQAQVTERTLTEQNERARLHLEFDLLTRMEDRFESSHFRGRRRVAARYLLDNAFVEDESAEMEPFTRAAADVGGIFEDLGYLQGLGILRAESVWNRFGKVTQVYWALCKPAIEKLRENWKAPELFTEFERLGGLMAELDHERGIAAPTQGVLQQYIEYESVIGEESPTTSE